MFLLPIYIELYHDKVKSYYFDRIRMLIWIECFILFNKLYHWLSTRHCTCSIWFIKERADRIDVDNLIYIVIKAQIIKVIIITQFEYSFEIVFRCKSFLDLTISYVVICQNITIFLVIVILINLDLQAHFFVSRVKGSLVQLEKLFFSNLDKK